MNYEKLIKEYQTPLYVFDIDKLKKRVEYLKRSIKIPNVELCYAIKANTFVVKSLSEMVERLEVCSPGEYYICEQQKIDDKKIVISGVYKDEKFIDYLIANKNIGYFTIESKNQYNLLKKLAETYQKKINVLIRVTSGNQFGIALDDLFEIVKESNSDKYLNIRGLEYFSGTQKHSLKKVEREFEYLANLLNKLKEDYHFDVKEIEYGTGFPVYYFIDEDFDEDAFLEDFSNLISKYLKNQKITLEIGRSIVASCGSYLTKVVDMKKNKAGNFAICDGGINHLVYYGGTMAMRVPHYEIIPKKNGNQEETWALCGALCTINDFLIKQVTVDTLEIGDVFCFKNTGAYSMTEGISLFLSRDLPKVVIVENKQSRLVRDIIHTYKINTIMEGSK